MDFKVTFTMDKKTIDCIDRLAGALAGINNIKEESGSIPLEKSEPVPVTETPQETTSSVQPEPASEPMPETAARVYTRDELSKAAAEFTRSGADKREKLQNLVKEKYGVIGLMDIPEERYGEFAADLREAGANI